MDNNLQTMTWVEVEQIISTKDTVAILPVGSIEQHGFHLPLGTDSYVAITLAEDAASKTGALLMPPVWYGYSPHHMVLPGTITIRPDVLADLVYDIAASLSSHGIKKLILLNGHRIVNVIWMQLAAERIQSTLDITVKIFDPAYMAKDISESLGFGPVGHAEEAETSHMMHRYPNLVSLEKAKDNPIQQQELYSVDPAYSGDTLCYVPSSIKHARENVLIAGGTTGEPTKADSENGKVYHDHLVNHLVSIIEMLKNDCGKE